MDLVLLIIILCFRGTAEKRNYNALITLSIIGAFVCLLMAFTYTWIAIFDVIWYGINFILCITADNQKTAEDQAKEEAEIEAMEDAEDE